MTTNKLQLRYARVLSLLIVSLFSATAAFAQITPLGDAYTNSADPTTNYGAATLLEVDGATATTYIQFNLASIPSGATVSQATLKLYVNAVTTAGSFNVDYVNGSWAESTIDHSNAPPLGTTIASNVDVTTADKNQYILINVTSAVQAWLSGSETNNGIALVANSTFNATFDSKENTTTSHPAELDIAYAGGDGTITGVTTASGSGLTGGGTSGTLDLSLTSACSVKQVLEWNGSAWACSNTGTGTITGVTAGKDLTGGGSSGNVTLNLDTTKVPLLAAANTFTGNQTVNGNLSATGVVTGSSYQIGSNLFAFGSYGNGNAFLGFAGNTQTTGLGNTASGYGALEQNITGSNNTAIGYEALVNLSGSNNTALGSGAGELGNDQTSNNTFVGAYTGTGTSNAVNNATAIGANAQVNESNALVLGSISGVNNATASTNVGIGTTTPQATLDVAGYNLETFIGNPDCVSAFAGIAFGTSGFNSCQNYSIVGDGSNTFVAAPTGSLVFRVNSNNTTAMTIASNGNISMSSELSIASNGNLIALNPADGNVLITGNLSVGGNVSKGSGDFKIDDPLDPANKYLYHSFVESPDMMNIYNGNVVTDKYGRATVVLPEYFAALNRDFRYQLTVIGQFAQAMVAKEIRHNRFMIKTNRPGVKVSWQVTGIRQDAYANAHRIPTEEEKPPQERGRYLHPELFGASQEQAVDYRPSLSRLLVLKSLQQQTARNKIEPFAGSKPSRFVEGQ
jgi:hypothetical protein